MQVCRSFHAKGISRESWKLPPWVSGWKPVCAWEKSEGWEFNKAKNALLNQAVCRLFSNQREFIDLEEERGSFKGYTENIFIFTLSAPHRPRPPPPQQNNQIVPGRGSFTLSTFLPATVLRGLKLSPGSPTGQACPFIWSGYLHRPLQLHIHTHVFIRTLRISLLEKPWELDCFPRWKFSFEK